MFKTGDLQSRFKFFLTGYRSLATIKILVILIVTVLKTILKIAFSNSMFSTKISYITQQV